MMVYKLQANLTIPYKSLCSTYSFLKHIAQFSVLFSKDYFFFKVIEQNLKYSLMHLTLAMIQLLMTCLRVSIGHPSGYCRPRFI